MQPITMCELLQKMDKRGDYAFMMEKGMQPTPALLPGESRGLRSLTEKSDTTEQHTHTHMHTHTCTHTCTHTRTHTHMHKHTHL